MIVLALLLLLGTVAAQLSLPCGYLLQPGDARFANASRVDNARVQRRAGVVAVALCEGDVVAAVQFAAATNATLSVLAGGHSAEGFGVAVDGALVVNVAGLRNFSLDAKSLQLTVGAGYKFAELYALLAAKDPTLLLVGGGCPDVGISGFMLGGGLSFLSRPFGAIGSDLVLAMRVVLANGTAATVTRRSDSVLFRALAAGGGGNFGVVVGFVVQLRRAFTAVQTLCFDNDKANAASLARLVPLYAAWLSDDATPTDFGAPALLLMRDNATVEFCVNAFGVAPRSKQAAADVAALALDGFFSIVARKARGAWNNATLDARNRTFYEFEADQSATALNGRFGHMSSFAFDDGELDDAFASALTAAVATAPDGGTLVNFHDMGGRLRHVRGSWFPHRDAILVLQLKVLWPHVSPSDDARHLLWAQHTTRALRSVAPAPAAAYVNYIESRATLPDWQLAYYGAQWPLLLRAKLRVDPAGLFRFAQAIAPPRCSFARAAMVNLAMAFQFAQTSMDAAAAASLFAADGATVIPVGHAADNSTRTVGRAAIGAHFQAYFDTLAKLDETIAGPVVVSGSVVAFAKQIDATLLNQTLASKFVVNWFNMTCGASGLLEIQEFDAAFQ